MPQRDRCGREPEIILGPPARLIRRPARGVLRQVSGRSPATFSRSTVIDRSQPIRSAITVAGIVGPSFSCSRIAGSASSAIEPFGARRYRGASSARSALRTVFFEIPSFRAIALIGRSSVRCRRRISAHSSKLITDPFCHAR